jgi:multidrug efflux pump subunit AcrA (membrane-fusion protein)
MANWVSAFFTVVIAFATIVYVVLTGRLWKETKRSADAATKSADATVEAAQAATTSANAAQESLRLLKQEYEDRIGQGPEILRQALINAKALTQFWAPFVAIGLGNPHGVPDPAPLEARDLAGALEHARRISPELSGLVSSALADLKFAKSEFDRIRQSYRGPNLYPAAVSGTGPRVYLERAAEAIDRALEILDT